MAFSLEWENDVRSGLEGESSWQGVAKRPCLPSVQVSVCVWHDLIRH